MNRIEERYISLLTDFGFKRIFGTAPNKDLLINFLNSLFDGKEVIKDVKYLNTEHFGDNASARKAIFDVYCEGEDGEKFIVEMQNAYQDFFKDRSLFYSTFTPDELREYEDSLKAYRDIKNSIDTARRDGRVEGEVQEKNATIKRLLASGASVDIIAIATGLPHDEVKHLIVEISKE